MMKVFGIFSLLACLAAPLSAQTVSAVLEPAQTAEVRSTVAGRIANIVVVEGVRVDIGALLAQIDSGVQQARVNLARRAADGTGQQQLASARLIEAVGLAERVRRARSSGAAQAWEVTAAEQAVKVAEAEQKIAQELQDRAVDQLALEQAILAEFDLIAPFDGVVLQILKEPGEIVDTQEVVLVFGHVQTLEATAFFPVSDIDNIEIGRSLKATVDAGALQENVSVNVLSVDRRIDPASRTFRVTLGLSNAENRFFAGSTLLIENR